MTLSHHEEVCVSDVCVSEVRVRGSECVGEGRVYVCEDVCEWTRAIAPVCAYEV